LAASEGGTRRALLSLMCHPDRAPAVDVPPGEGYEVFDNRTPNYADAYRAAIARAMRGGLDLVTADTDGYHPVPEIVKLARDASGAGRPTLTLPYRENLGFQSKAYSWLYSLIKGQKVRDATGGLCRLSLELMASLPPLRSRDMTIHIEILNAVIASGGPIVQYGYMAGANERGRSNRTSNYQLKLLRRAFG
jgi:hypothetical protein